jgi:D-alanine-D-alanine ligase
MGMRINDLLVAVVYNVEEIGDDHPFSSAQVSNVYSSNCIYDALCSLGFRAAKIPIFGTFEQINIILDPLSRENTLIFNNIDGFGSDPLGAAHALQFIEEMGFFHTGSTGEVTLLCTNKAEAKQKLLSAGLPTPAFQVFDRPAGEIHIRFPAIVKPLFQDASIGISRNSVVNTPQALYRQVSQVIEQNYRKALAEEFITGRELSVAMLGEEFLAISEEDYTDIPDILEHLITYDAKWNPQDYLYQNIILRCPASLSKKEENNIFSLLRQAKQVLGLRDYGRIDIRYQNEIPYILEANEIPDFGANAGFFNSAGVSGYTYEQMIQSIIKISLERGEH